MRKFLGRLVSAVRDVVEQVRGALAQPVPVPVRVSRPRTNRRRR